MVDPALNPRSLKVLKRISINAGEGTVLTLLPGTYQTRLFALDVPMGVALWVLDPHGNAYGWMSKAEADAAEKDGMIAWA